jgi:hypothetical protein
MTKLEMTGKLAVAYATARVRGSFGKPNHMKIKHLLLLTLSLLVWGCKREAKSVHPPPTESRTLSDGNFTWYLGSVTNNGTNVLLNSTNFTVKVRVMTNQESQ